MPENSYRIPYGYFTSNGYWGLVGDHFILFASDSDYYEYIESRKDDE